MKPTLLAALAASLLILPGCASIGDKTQLGDGASAYCESVDCAKMDQISRGARRNGHLVIWVHPPLKSKTDIPPRT